MFVKEIEINGFKSYAQRTYVGPFDPTFNAITGLNGSGKSNILDAICFVLGLQNTKTMRADNLQGLVYKSGQAGVNKATVSITFDNSDKRSSPPTYEQYKEIVISRQVIIGGRSKFHVNNLIANQERVIDLFRSVQLNVNNPHFLIMQGRVQQVLRMKPMEILGMIEEAAGTRLYETKKEKAERTIKRKEKQVNEIDEILTKEIEPCVEKLRRDREAYNQYQKLDREYQQLKRLTTAFEFNQLKGGGDRLQAEIQKHQDDFEKMEQEKRTLGEAKLLLEKKIEDLKQQLQDDPAVADADAKLEAASKRLQEVKKEETAKGAEKKKMEREMQQLEKNISAESKSLEQKRQDLQKAESSLGDAEKMERDMMDRIGKAEAKLDALMRGRDTDAQGNQVSVQQQLIDTRRELTQTQTEQKNAQEIEKRVQPQLNAMEEERRKMARRSSSGEADATKRKIEELQKQLAESQARMASLGGDHQASSSKLRELQDRRNQLLDVQRREDRAMHEGAAGRLRFDYNPPAGFDTKRVRGCVGSLLTVDKVEAGLALEKAAGGKLYSVVVDNDQTADTLLNTRNCLRRRTTFLPLNRVNGRALDPDKLQRVNNKFGEDSAFYARNCVSYADDVAPAMAYAFGDAMIFRDPENARKAAYELRIGCRCIALDGSNFDPSGRISGGKQSSSGIMEAVNKFSEARKRHHEAEQSIAKINAEIIKLRETSDEQAALEQRANGIQMEIDGLRARLGANDLNRLETDIAEIKQVLDDAKSKMTEYRKRIAELKAQEEDLKHKINNADAYKKAEQKKAEAELKGLNKERNERKAEFAKSKETLDTLRSEIKDLEETIVKLSEELGPKREQIQQCEVELEERKAAVREAQETRGSAESAKKDAEQRAQQRKKERERMEAELKQHTDRIDDINVCNHKLVMEIDQLRERVKDAEKRVAAMRREHRWIQEDEPYFGVAGSAFDFADFVHADAEARLGQLRAERKKLETNADFKDFNSIFSQLLPHTQAKLEIPAGFKSPLDGLEIKVALGDDWKDSLDQLSGGQKSLVALSLILAMLKFKPAPIYILDEVDAALDLSHTQNIGAMIKKHFQSSQFIIVSLKDGMFNHANVLFKTRFVDGCSTVARHTDRSK